MSYYYTVKEYASIKGLDLSVQDEVQVKDWATNLSNERGVAINKVQNKNSNRKTSCFSIRILNETFKALDGKPVKVKAKMLASV
ncbi:hypothetical protein [Pontibacter harenae]|uniref:hypothetical protein n=1 Tax=Pontibacter harenae TaxID=2894083 RepID=UPI001E2C9BA3|nr:hypothetical protein [Pontibacter harenae]MCC9166267.1 hypothetical protein [Pontibacter harenae]